MRALVKGVDGLELREVPDPEPASDEMLVRVEAVSLNRGEIRTVELAREGTIPGWDAAGTVVRSAADGRGPAEGSRVFAILRSGAWAELAAVPRGSAANIPEGVTPEQASTLPIAALTAYRALALAEPLLGRRVLITGASGGVGRFAVQLARRGGARVCGVVSPAREKAVRQLGAHSTVSSVAGAGGEFDLILESVGGSSMSDAIDRVASGGVVVSIGNSSAEETTFNPRSLYRKTGARIHGLLIFDEVDEGRVGSRELGYLCELVAEGALDTSIGWSGDWSEIDTALGLLRERKVEGKAVLGIS